MCADLPVDSFIKDTHKGVVLSVKLAPRTSSNRIIGVHAGRLKIGVTAPPVDGKANELLIEFLAKLLGIAKRSVVIIRGETSREKDVVISDSTPDTIISRINGALK